MKLLKKKVVRLGKEYTDFYLRWTYEDKEYNVRVRHVFSSDFPILFSQADNLEE